MALKTDKINSSEFSINQSIEGLCGNEAWHSWHCLTDLDIHGWASVYKLCLVSESAGILGLCDFNSVTYTIISLKGKISLPAMILQEH